MISQRARSIDASGIRRVFDLAAKLKNPINLSMGQPDFQPWPEVQEAAIEAIQGGKNGYTVSAGIPELRAKLRSRYGIESAAEGTDDVLVTAGVSGGFLLSYLVLCDPGDEVLLPDPFFVVYRDLALALNIVPTYYDTYPDFSLRAERIEAAIGPKTKAIVVNSPANPTGYTCSQQELDDVVAIARKHDLFLIYDEIYSDFCFDKPHAQCFGNYEKVIILNGFSKSAGVAGWRLGYVVAPRVVLSEMIKLQQYSVVCANSIGQWAMLPALDIDFTEMRQQYVKKRDFMTSALSEKFSFAKPGGAFYLFPEAPGGESAKFVERCIENNVLVVPGSAFSRRDTHFRISFSAPLDVLERGAEVLCRLA